MEQNAAKIVSSAILGMDFKVVIVNGKSYIVTPPTIKKIAGAAYWMSDLEEAKTTHEMKSRITNMSHALSWFIQGDDSLYEELIEGEYHEVKQALDTAYSLLSPEDFSELSVLAKNVARLAAKQRQ